MTYTIIATWPYSEPGEPDSMPVSEFRAILFFPEDVKQSGVYKLGHKVWVPVQVLGNTRGSGVVIEAVYP